MGHLLPSYANLVRVISKSEITLMETNEQCKMTYEQADSFYFINFDYFMLSIH